MMKPLIPAAILALSALSARADDLIVQLNGPGLAESAGYVVAQARGYYAEEGLQVTLRPAEDSAIPLEALARGQADLAVEYLPVALLARENGLPVVNFAQPFARPALRLNCLREAGVTSAADLRGRTIGSAYDGLELALQAWLNRLGLRADDSLEGVTLLHQWPQASDMLRENQAACISVPNYAPPQVEGTVLLDPQEQGAAVLEDGLYALSQTLNDDQGRERLAAFLRASMKGWQEALRDPDMAARSVLGDDPDPGALARQTQAIGAMAGILSADGALDEQDYRRSVDSLRAGGAAAVLRADPVGAFTQDIHDMLRATQDTPAADSAP